MRSFELVVVEPSFFRNCKIIGKNIALEDSFSERKVMALENLLTKVKNDSSFSHLSFESFSVRRYQFCFDRESQEIFDIYQFSLGVRDFPERKREVYIVIGILPGKTNKNFLKGISKPLSFRSLDYAWLNNYLSWHFWQDKTTHK